MNISAGLGVAVREFPLTTGFADYMLYADGKAIGVVEAKPEGHTLTGVETQSAKYTRRPARRTCPHYRLPLPFAYESTGDVTQFTNDLEPDARSREVFTFHRPEELLRLVEARRPARAPAAADAAARTPAGLWRVQIESDPATWRRRSPTTAPAR